MSSTETEKPKVWSPQQQAVFQWVETGKGSAFVKSRAGTGKTTTIVEGCRRMEGDIAFAAYNKKISAEIGVKVADMTTNTRKIDAKTFHAFGLRAWSSVHRRVEVANGNKKAKELVRACQIPEGCEEFCLQLLSLAKNNALGLFGSVEDDSQWFKIIDHHDLTEKLEDKTILPRAIELTKAALKLSTEMATKLVDFDDMIYMPVISGCHVDQRDWVLVDEAQDTNPARRALARKMLKPEGRAIFVGDDHQAIYGFTGADADAVDLIIKEFNCEVLPLTVTYRCPKAVVRRAQEYVPDIEAHPSAPDGRVDEIELDELMARAKKLAPTDAVLCRLTAPLIKMAFDFIKQGIGCHVEGRDIGAGLIKLTDKWKTVKTVDQLEKKLDTYFAKEVERHKAKGNELAAEAAQDRYDTMVVLMDGVETLEALRTKIVTLFRDTEDGHKTTLTLSTVHKSKGREWPDVYVLGFNKYMPSKWARQQWQMDQELNLIYVAFTRAQRTLTLVNVPEKQDMRFIPETPTPLPVPVD